jgi:hypothetical protein
VNFTNRIPQKAQISCRQCHSQITETRKKDRRGEKERKETIKSKEEKRNPKKGEWKEINVPD